MKPFDAHGLVAALNGATGEDMDGWIRTKDLLPLIGVKTLAGIRTPLERITKAGFAEVKLITKKNLAYRLSKKFKTWDDAHNAAIELDRFKAPAGWVTLTQYARKELRTVRGIQYRIDGQEIPVRILKMPRPVPHYRRTDLDRLLRKAP
jgi:DNA-binding transcriptional regulator PaaX